MPIVQEFIVRFIIIGSIALVTGAIEKRQLTREEIQKIALYQQLVVKLDS